MEYEWLNVKVHVGCTVLVAEECRKRKWHWVTRRRGMGTGVGYGIVGNMKGGVGKGVGK